MEYLDYAINYDPITLPNDKKSVPTSILETPIPTSKLDSKRAIQSKEVVPKFELTWSSHNWTHYNVKDEYRKFLTSWEGGNLHKVAGDRGGLTNNGITLSTWKKFGSDKNGDGKVDDKDLAMITTQDQDNIFQQRFWSPARADEIRNPYLAAYVVDWMWNSGPKAFKSMHEAFGLKPQSKMTQGLLNALNDNPQGAFGALQNARKNYYYKIVRNDPTQAKFLKGWLRRADAITLDGFVFNS